MNKTRKFRIRTKHYERMMMILIMSAFVVIGRAVLTKRRLAHNQSLASIDTRAVSANSDIKTKMATVSYFENIRHALGSDDYGKLAFTLLLRNVAQAFSNTDWKVAKLCISDDYCPVPLIQLYSRALQRLPADKFAFARINLQAQMMKAQMSPQAKRAILTKALATQTGSMNSTIGADRKIRLSPLTDYQTLTLMQLESLKPRPKQFVQTALQVVRNSRDSVGKKYMIQTLARSYPRFHKEIFSQARQMGMSLAAR